MEKCIFIESSNQYRICSYHSCKNILCKDHEDNISEEEMEKINKEIEEMSMYEEMIIDNKEEYEKNK